MVVLCSIHTNCSGQDMLIIRAKACQAQQQARRQTQTSNSTKLPERHQNYATGNIMRSYGSFENSQQAWKGLAACWCTTLSILSILGLPVLL